MIFVSNREFVYIRLHGREERPLGERSVCIDILHDQIHQGAPATKTGHGDN